MKTYYFFDRQINKIRAAKRIQAKIAKISAAIISTAASLINIKAERSKHNLQGYLLEIN